MKIALAHRRRLGELSSAEIRGMLVEVRRPNSARWELATVVSSAAAPQRRARKEGGANSLAEAAGGVASGGASGVESDAPSASHAHTANASDAHAAVTKCYRVSLASPRRGGRATVVVVSSEHIRQRDSSWEWTTVSAENCIRRDAAAVRATSAGGVRAPPADHARVTCEVNVLPYLFSAAPRLVSGRACVHLILPRAHELRRFAGSLAPGSPPPHTPDLLPTAPNRLRCSPTFALLPLFSSQVHHRDPAGMA